jgi:hypothetical protein
MRRPSYSPAGAVPLETSEEDEEDPQIIHCPRAYQACNEQATMASLAPMYFSLFVH